MDKSDIENKLEEAENYILYLESLLDVVREGKMPEDITLDHLQLLGYYIAFNKARKFAKGV